MEARCCNWHPRVKKSSTGYPGYLCIAAMNSVSMTPQLPALCWLQKCKICSLCCHVPFNSQLLSSLWYPAFIVHLLESHKQLGERWSPFIVNYATIYNFGELLFTATSSYSHLLVNVKLQVCRVWFQKPAAMCMYHVWAVLSSEHTPPEVVNQFW